MDREKISLRGRLSRGQTILEYALLVSVSVLAFLAASSFIFNLKDGAFENHFTVMNEAIRWGR